MAPRLGLVSKWVANGTVRTFVKAHQDANRINLVSLLLVHCNNEF